MDVPADALVGHRYWTAVIENNKVTRVYGWGNWTWQFPGVNEAECKCYGNRHDTSPPGLEVNMPYAGNCGFYAHRISYTKLGSGYLRPPMSQFFNGNTPTTMHIVGEVNLWGNVRDVNKTIVRAQYAAVKSLHLLPPSGPAFELTVREYPGIRAADLRRSVLRYNRRLRELFGDVIPLTSITKRTRYPVLAEAA